MVIKPATGAMTRGRGRPKVPNPKEHISLRLYPETIEAFRSAGPGWRTRMAEALRKAAGF